MADMPQALGRALDSLAASREADGLARDAREISENYRLRTGKGRRLLTREGEAAAYAVSRMPATFAAAQAALRESLAASGLNPATLLDCGAGTGAVTFAADTLLPLTSILCMERETAMRTVGERLMRAYGGAPAEAVWAACNLAGEDPLPRAQLVCEGYMLGELREDARIPAALRMWNAAEQMLLCIEPGTPQGFANLNAVRDALTREGAYLAAPCPSGQTACPMRGKDWCHFAVRVQRTRLHRQLKGGAAPYEDEKFCYMAFTRTPPQAACAARILRHPQVAPGRIVLTLCEEGRTGQRVISKKDPLWKRARKATWGDSFASHAGEKE